MCAPGEIPECDCSGSSDVAPVAVRAAKLFCNLMFVIDTSVRSNFIGCKVVERNRCSFADCGAKICDEARESSLKPNTTCWYVLVLLKARASMQIVEFLSLSPGLCLARSSQALTAHRWRRRKGRRRGVRRGGSHQHKRSTCPVFEGQGAKHYSTRRL